MNCLIISIDHGMQVVPLRDEGAKSIESKARIRALVRQAIANRDVDLICEESDPRHLTIAQEEAYKNITRIPWKNIIMTAQERLEAGIWEALLYCPFDQKFLDESNAVAIEHRIPEDDIREEFFKDQILEAAEAYGADNVLVLCGDMHADAMKTKLEESGHHVEIDRDLISEKRWQ